MASFSIRRNYPHAGVLSLCKIPGGGFVAREMTVPEGVFLAAVMMYLEKLTPEETARLRRAHSTEVAVANVTPKPFKVRKTVAAVG